MVTSRDVTVDTMVIELIKEGALRPEVSNLNHLIQKLQHLC